MSEIRDAGRTYLKHWAMEKLIPRYVTRDTLPAVPAAVYNVEVQ